MIQNFGAEYKSPDEARRKLATGGIAEIDHVSYQL